MPTSEDHQLAAHLAALAGAALLELRTRLDLEGSTVATIRDAGDRAAHEVLVQGLADQRPEDAVLSEEDGDRDRDGDGAGDPAGDRAGATRPARSGAPRVWIVDPLDGTREYGEGRSDWAVHVALVEDGTPTAGAVALPELGLVLGTPTVALPPATSGRPRLVLSRTRRPAEALAIAEHLDTQIIEMGSAGAKAMAVVRGEADIYAHAGGQYEWDSAAPVAVAMAAGLHCSRLDGSPLRYNNPDPYLPDLLICRPEYASAALAAAAAV